ncbi:uncharacterized protein LOC143256107 isoform X2 [Tachypleus tridentatus]|uniref:uncharacterized protein LOC143256107 isoform X2 n=1 Tax=Tachypleus tridentatus TaxID=6853 RepID=UPI003FCFE868
MNNLNLFIPRKIFIPFSHHRNFLMLPYTPPAESARFNIAYLGMIPQCLLIQNLLEGLKKVHSRCALLILGSGFSSVSKGHVKIHWHLDSCMHCELMCLQSVSVKLEIFLYNLDHVTSKLYLFMTWDWATYFHDYGQENSKY